MPDPFDAVTKRALAGGDGDLRRSVDVAPPRPPVGIATVGRGAWDMVGNNIPLFLIQDAIGFSGLIHAGRMKADRSYPPVATAHDTF